MTRRRKIAVGVLVGMAAYLAAEATLPARVQPTARVALLLIDGYQATGSRALAAAGAQCRFTPSCSHYAEAAIAHYGTLDGGFRAARRILRCAPWGSGGYDPAVREAAFVVAQEEEPSAESTEQDPDERPVKRDDETDEEFRRRLQRWQQERAEKMARDFGAEAAAGCAIGLIGCVITTVVIYAIIIVIMIWVYKDAKARGDQNAVLWLILIFFLGLIGLVIYLVARPKGDLAPCPNCSNSRMTTLTKCPHCGAESGDGGKG